MRPFINLSRLYSIRLFAQTRAFYDKLDLYEEADNPNLVDTSGYLGLFYRGDTKRTLPPLTESELVEILVRDNRLAAIMRVIRDIDQDNNGYVTNQELDDIFKLHYEKELGQREIKQVFKKFASIQNRILIDYKKVRDYFTKKVQELTEAEKNIKQFLKENDLAGFSRQDEGGTKLIDQVGSKAKSVTSRCTSSHNVGDQRSQVSSASLMHRRKLS